MKKKEIQGIYEHSPSWNGFCLHSRYRFIRKYAKKIFYIYIYDT